MYTDTQEMSVLFRKLLNDVTERRIRGRVYLFVCLTKGFSPP